MSLSLNQKKAVISEVTEAIASAQAGVLAEYRGMTVAETNRSAKGGAQRRRVDQGC